MQKSKSTLVSKEMTGALALQGTVNNELPASSVEPVFLMGREYREIRRAMDAVTTK